MGKLPEYQLEFTENEKGFSINDGQKLEHVAQVDHSTAIVWGRARQLTTLFCKSPELYKVLTELLDAMGNPMVIPPHELVEKASKLLSEIDNSY